MPFVLTEEQQMLRDSAKAYAAEKLPVSQLRALRKDGKAYDAGSWKEIAELGFTGVIVPEEFGGSGFGYVGLGQVLEAQGRTLAASPLLRAVGREAVCGRWRRGGSADRGGAHVG